MHVVHNSTRFHDNRLKTFLIILLTDSGYWRIYYLQKVEVIMIIIIYKNINNNSKKKKKKKRRRRKAGN